MIMIDRLIFIVVMSMVITSLALAIKSIKKCRELQNKIANMDDTIRFTSNKCDELTKNLILSKKNFDELKSDYYTQVTLLTSQITELSHIIDILRRDTVNAMNAIRDDIISRIPMERMDATINRNENDIESLSVSYQWIFPQDDPRFEKEFPPIIGKEYLVVGTIKDLTDSSGNQMIFTDHALFTKSGFYTANDKRFNKVYAYIQEPSSSDIWEKVMALAIEAE